MPGAQINPILIQQLTGKDITEIPDSPTLTWIPGTYARLVYKHKEKIKRHFGENTFMIKCKSCERKGKYDVGMMVINTDREDPQKSVQTTGYFRCKHCNDAGKWEMPSQFIIATTAGILAHGLSETNNRFMVGESLLYDGSWHLFCSDSEQHLLTWNLILRLEPPNHFIQLQKCIWENETNFQTVCELTRPLSLPNKENIKNGRNGKRNRMAV